jgi:hypothetical protein
VTDDELAMSDLVFFELPSSGDVERFCSALTPRWRAWSIDDGEVWLAAVDVRTEEVDLAALLREAQAVIAELALPEICFCLDGRVYWLEARVHRDAAAVA